MRHGSLTKFQTQGTFPEVRLVINEVTYLSASAQTLGVAVTSHSRTVIQDFVQRLLVFLLHERHSAHGDSESDGKD